MGSAASFTSNITNGFSNKQNTAESNRSCMNNTTLINHQRTTNLHNHNSSQSNTNTCSSHDNRSKPFVSSLLAEHLQALFDELHSLQLIYERISYDDINTNSKTAEINNSIKLIQLKDANLEYSSSCAICLNNIEDVLVAQLCCKHNFHINCIKNWLQYKLQCPVCRCQISNTTTNRQTFFFQDDDEYHNRVHYFRSLDNTHNIPLNEIIETHQRDNEELEENLLFEQSSLYLANQAFNESRLHIQPTCS